MVPINNVSHERLQYIASTFQCQAGAFPFTYLGLPLRSNNPTIQDCMPLVHRVERRLVSTSILLSQGGKHQLVNSALPSMPTFFMCAVKLPIDILNQIDKYRRHEVM
jgi:hypothetical protein